jgi:hypothetical protein
MRGYGITEGETIDKNNLRPLALAGRVPVKVCIENGPIQIGDMLTTSSTPGFAMKATDRNLGFGAIIGKALESFDGSSNDKNKILVLVNLQ